MPQPLALLPAGPPALRGAGVAALRTAQTAGIEWLDLAKQNFDDFTATWERMAACRDAASALALQGAYLRRVGERTLSRTVAVADLMAGLVGQLAGFGTPPGPRHP